MRCRIEILVLALLALLSAGCREMPVHIGGDKPLAKVGNRELTLSEIGPLATGADSAQFIALYTEKWIKKQLKLREAEELFSTSEDDIEAMVEEYRQSLLIRKLDRHYVDNQIDTVFTEDELQQYYNAHLSDFKLDRTIVKGRLLRYDARYRQAKRLKTLMGAVNAERKKDLEDICTKNDFMFKEFTSWVDLREFLLNLPVAATGDHSKLLASSSVQQLSDGNYGYCFQITAVRRAGDAEPLECVRPTIRRILFNQRQNEIIRAHEDTLYRQALADGRARRLYDE